MLHKSGSAMSRLETVGSDSYTSVVWAAVLWLQNMALDSKGGAFDDGPCVGYRSHPAD